MVNYINSKYQGVQVVVITPGKIDGSAQNKASLQARGLPCSSDSKESACNAGDLGSIPGLGRSSGEENGNPVQYSVFLPVELHRQRTLAGYSRGVAESDTTERLIPPLLLLAVSGNIPIE